MFISVWSSSKIHKRLQLYVQQGWDKTEEDLWMMGLEEIQCWAHILKHRCDWLKANLSVSLMLCNAGAVKLSSVACIHPYIIGCDTGWPCLIHHAAPRRIVRNPLLYIMYTHQTCHTAPVTLNFRATIFHQGLLGETPSGKETVRAGP